MEIMEAIDEENKGMVGVVREKEPGYEIIRNNETCQVQQSIHKINNCGSKPIYDLVIMLCLTDNNECERERMAVI